MYILHQEIRSVFLNKAAAEIPISETKSSIFLSSIETLPEGQNGEKNIKGRTATQFMEQHFEGNRNSKQIKFRRNYKILKFFLR